MASFFENWPFCFLKIFLILKAPTNPPPFTKGEAEGGGPQSSPFYEDARHLVGHLTDAGQDAQRPRKGGGKSPFVSPFNKGGLRGIFKRLIPIYRDEPFVFFDFCFSGFPDQVGE